MSANASRIDIKPHDWQYLRYCPGVHLAQTIIQLLDCLWHIVGYDDFEIVDIVLPSKGTDSGRKIIKYIETESQIDSKMVSIGENQTYTAMSKTVGLPLGIFVKLVLEGKISARGVQIPVMREVYEPVLRELEEDYSVVFKEKLIEL